MLWWKHLKKSGVLWSHPTFQRHLRCWTINPLVTLTGELADHREFRLTFGACLSETCKLHSLTRYLKNSPFWGSKLCSMTVSFFTNNSQWISNVENWISTSSLAALFASLLCNFHSVGHLSHLGGVKNDSK